MADIYEKIGGGRIQTLDLLVVAAHQLTTPTSLGYRQNNGFGLAGFLSSCNAFTEYFSSKRNWTLWIQELRKF